MRRVVMSILWLSVPTLAAAQQTPNGGAVYKQLYAGCHEGTMARTVKAAQKWCSTSIIHLTMALT
jgi:cytochrome c5